MSETNDPLRLERTVTSNGLTVTRQAPPAASASFAATYIGPAGWAYEPAGKAGVAFLVSQLVTSGAGRRDRVALARLLDSYGATLSHQCDPESVELTVWGPNDTFEPLLEVLADVVLRPRFDADDLERARRQAYERQLREASQPEHRASREMLRALFPRGHPYRESGVGTRPSVAGITRADLRRFHRDHFTPDGAHLIVTGRPSLDQVARLARERFRDWAVESSPPAPTLPELRGIGAPTRTIEMEGRSQVELRLGGLSIPRADPLFPEATLANEVLGGRSLLSRLFQKVRERAGLAYHAASDLEAMRWGGYWQARAGTGPERVDAAQKLIEREVRRLGEELVPSDELERIRESAIGELPLSLETTAGAHDLAADVAYHGLPDDFLLTWPATLRAVTPSAIRAAIPHVLDARNAVAFRVGPVSPARRGR